MVTKRLSVGKPAKMKADPEQYQRFLDAAHNHGCEKDVGRLDEVVRRVAKLSPDRRIEPDRPKAGGKAREK